MSSRIPYLASPISAAHRCGVSLLEVLFSIGIVAVGLLGIMVLLPIGGSRVAHGIVADTADRVGRSAIRQFDVERMRQRNRWWAGYNLIPAPAEPDTSGGSYCVDPRFLATHLTVANLNLPTNAGYFPYFAPPLRPNVTPPLMASLDSRMRRISLTGDAVIGAVMTLGQAEQTFLSQDDLTVTLPDDRTLLPIQNFGSGNPIKRQYEGRFSWLATLTPKDTLASDLYVLSIVVFNRRDSDMTLPLTPPSQEEPENERLVDVIQFPGGGLAGGDVRLQLRPSRPSVDLKLREGEWIMLVGTRVDVFIDPNTNQPFRDVTERRFKWYRITGVQSDLSDDYRDYVPLPPVQQVQPPIPKPFMQPPPVVTPGIDGLQEHNVTLFGQDWDPTLITQAVLMNGVVAVYEKTIRLETSSLWTAQ